MQQLIQFSHVFNMITNISPVNYCTELPYLGGIYDTDTDTFFRTRRSEQMTDKGSSWGSRNRRAADGEGATTSLLLLLLLRGSYGCPRNRNESAERDGNR